MLSEGELFTGYTRPDVSRPSFLADYNKILADYCARTGYTTENHMRQFFNSVKSRAKTVANPVLMQLKNELLAIRRRHFYTRKRSEKIRLRKIDEVKREQIHQCITRLVGEPDEERIAQLKKQKAEAERLLPQYMEECWVEETVPVQASLFDANPQVQMVSVDKNKRKREELQRTIARCDADIAYQYNKTVPTGFESAVLEVTQWNPYDQNTVSPFLDLEWMFGIRDGFDIVIGNPPYIQLQAEKGKLANLYAPCGYETFLRGGDIYCLFYERAWQLLKQHGYMVYITSNKWMRAGYGSELRGFLTRQTNPQLLIDFNETHVFESACVMTNILAFRREDNTRTLMAVQTQEDFVNPATIANYFDKHAINCNFEGNEGWVIKTDFERGLKRKVEEQGMPLMNWKIEINYGIKTGYNPAFFVTTEERDEILANCADGDERKRTEKLIRPMLRGKDIRRYGTEWADLWLIGTFPAKKLNIDDYPAVKAHLLSFGMEKLEQTGKKYKINGEDVKARKKSTNKWFETQDSIKYWQDFAKPKIIYPNMTKFMPFVYDEEGFFHNDKSFFMTGEHISYLAAMFNSSLFKYCFADNFPPLFGGSRELRKIFFDKIPIKEVTDEQDNEFHALVLDIQKEYTDAKAKAIDQKIFDLYGLSPEEREAIGYIEF